MEPLESTTFCFLLWKEYFFFFTPIAPTSSTFGIWVSLNEIRCFMRGHPSRIVEPTTISKWSSLLTQSQDNTRCKAQHGPPQANHQELLPMSCSQPHNLCKENPNIVYKITFNSLPLKLMSFHYIWISPFHTMAMHYIIIHTCTWL